MACLSTQTVSLPSDENKDEEREREREREREGEREREREREREQRESKEVRKAGYYPADEDLLYLGWRKRSGM